MNRKFAIILILSLAVFTSCSNVRSDSKTSSESGIVEDRSVYEKDQGTNVDEVYITILPSSGDFAENTFRDMNEKIYDDIEMNVLFQDGKDKTVTAKDFGYGLTGANAQMELRGQSARIASQKSYKIKLEDGCGLWKGNRVINLNKHPFDYSRFRNKLTFDLIQSIDNLTSLRTSFVHMYIKDFSEEDYDSKYEDFGLFTQIENVDSDFLKSHGLDRKGSLYKAENFEFFRYPDSIRLKDDPKYDEEAFEDILEIKGNDNHQKLISMLEDVNNELIPIDNVIERHFDRENYMTWMALNFLTDNIDTASRNFYLYSPEDSEKWYFLPWDYDKAWGGYSHSRGQWQEGISNYWGVVLHRRFLKSKKNIEDLTVKVEQLHKILNTQSVQMLVDEYSPIVSTFLSRKPDSLNKSVGIERFKRELESIVNTPEKSKKAYYDSIQRPMPVFMGDPFYVGEYCTFKWSASYDLQDDFIKYNLWVSDSPSFENVIRQREGITDTECIVKGLAPGRYYWKLEIIDSNGNSQDAFNIYVDRKRSLYYFGVKEFYVY